MRLIMQIIYYARQSGFDRSSSRSFYSETGDIPGSSETRDLCYRSSLSAESRMDSEKMLKRGKSRSRLDRKRESLVEDFI